MLESLHSTLGGPKIFNAEFLPERTRTASYTGCHNATPFQSLLSLIDWRDF